MAMWSAWALERFDIEQNQVKYVYDGDTFFIHCQPHLMCKNGKLGVRALGLDTPEMKGECESEKQLARLAKQLLVTLKNQSQTITIEYDPKRPYDKYDRLLAHVRFDQIDWTDVMITSNLGRVWTGKRGGWC